MSGEWGSEETRSRFRIFHKRESILRGKFQFHFVEGAFAAMPFSDKPLNVQYYVAFRRRKIQKKSVVKSNFRWTLHRNCSNKVNVCRTGTSMQIFTNSYYVSIIGKNTAYQSINPVTNQSSNRTINSWKNQLANNPAKYLYEAKSVSLKIPKLRSFRNELPSWSLNLNSSSGSLLKLNKV